MSYCPSCHSALTEPELWCDDCGAHPTNELGGELATFGRRAAAAAIDGAAAVTWVSIAIWVESTGQSDFFDPPYSLEENALIWGTLAYVVVAVWLTFTGRSIGKAALGLRVVDSEGSVASIPRLLLRETIGKLASLAPMGIGFFVAFPDDRCQTFHDRIAMTYVVHHGAVERRRLRRRQVGSARRRRREHAV